MNKILVKKFGVWFLAFSLFAFHVISRSVAHAETGTNLKKVFSQSGECHIGFPCTPQMVQQTIPLADGKNRLSYDVYLAPHEEKGVYLLLVATYPSSLSQGQEIAGLEGLLNGIVGHNPENKLIYANLTEIQGRQAINFLVQGGNNYFRGTALMSGNKLYLIAMEGLQTHQDEPTYLKFLKSFKLN